MEQLNTVLPKETEELETGKTQESPLLVKVRQKFEIYGGCCLFFGILLALLFYKAGVGLNLFVFSLAILCLFTLIMKGLSIQVKPMTKFYYIIIVFLGLSSLWTSSGTLHFFNIIGILLLLDLILLTQFNRTREWDFMKYVVKMLGMIFKSLLCIPRPFCDSGSFLSKSSLLKSKVVRNILLGILIAIPLSFFILFLLSNADLLFMEMTNRVFGRLFSGDILAVTFIIFYGFIVSYTVLCGSIQQASEDKSKLAKKADASIAITFMTVLCFIYMIFCLIQVVYLFTNGLFVLPQNFTFAEYARRGFFELLAVTIFNIVLMLFTNACFKESKLLKFLITLMTICTYIMIASAAYRMLLYIDAYHLTFLRVFVLFLLVIDGLVLAGIIISQYQKRFPLFPYCVAVVSLCYILFVFAKPDAYIASYIINQKEKLNEADISYLTSDLSLDAAPYVIPILKVEDKWEEGIGHVVIEEHYKDYYERRIARVANKMGIRDFNYATQKAIKQQNQ